MHRQLLVIQEANTNSDAVCDRCQHLDMRHSPVEPPRMACGLFKEWLDVRHGLYVRRPACLEAEQRARHLLPQCDWVSGYGNRCTLPAGHPGEGHMVSCRAADPFVVRALAAKLEPHDYSTDPRLADALAHPPGPRHAQGRCACGLVAGHPGMCDFSSEPAGNTGCSCEPIDGYHASWCAFHNAGKRPNT